jgi:hypothetical protein
MRHSVILLLDYQLQLHSIHQVLFVHVLHAVFVAFNFGWHMLRTSPLIHVLGVREWYTCT